MVKLTLISNNVGLNPLLQATLMHLFGFVFSHSTHAFFLTFSVEPLPLFFKVKILVKIQLQHTKSKKKKEKVKFCNKFLRFGYIQLFLLYFFKLINKKLTSLTIDLIDWVVEFTNASADCILSSVKAFFILLVILFEGISE